VAVGLRPLVSGCPSRVHCLALGTFRPSLTLPCLTLSRYGAGSRVTSGDRDCFWGRKMRSRDESRYNRYLVFVDSEGRTLVVFRWWVLQSGGELRLDLYCTHTERCMAR
jgi:hypothetical protein